MTGGRDDELMQFITSRSEALDKLKKFRSDISNYNAKRNFDFSINDEQCFCITLHNS